MQSILERYQEHVRRCGSLALTFAQFESLTQDLEADRRRSKQLAAKCRIKRQKRRDR